MKAPAERQVTVNGFRCRVWEAGDGNPGAPLAFLGGVGGVPTWSPFLAQLAGRRRVIVPSLPGFPGGLGHEALDDVADWTAATLDLLEEAGFFEGDLVAASVGGMLAAEVAALCRPMVRRLSLIAPFGLFDAAEPVADLFARTAAELPPLLCADPARLAAEWALPEGEDPLEWQVAQARAAEAAARLVWPFGDRGLARRLHRITAPTLLLWGAEDRVVPPSYAKRFAAGIGGAATLREIPGAGHLAHVDAPMAAAEAVLGFLGEARGANR